MLLRNANYPTPSRRMQTAPWYGQGGRSLLSPGLGSEDKEERGRSGAKIGARRAGLFTQVLDAIGMAE